MQAEEGLRLSDLAGRSYLKSAYAALVLNVVSRSLCRLARRILRQALAVTRSSPNTKHGRSR